LSEASDRAFLVTRGHRFKGKKNISRTLPTAEETEIRAKDDNDEGKESKGKATYEFKPPRDINKPAI